jgi:hypothetical protein
MKDFGIWFLGVRKIIYLQIKGWKVFEKNIPKAIDFYTNQISVLQKDLKSVEGLVSEKTTELIEQEININIRKIKEAELQIKYIDYQ